MEKELAGRSAATKALIRNNYIKLGLAVTLCYMGCYIGKTILSAFTPRLTELGVFVKDDIGTMGFALFLAYGIGQLVNGILGDYFNPKRYACLGLTLSSALVSLSPLVADSFDSVTPSIALWAAIGFVSSMMWGPLTAIVADNSSGRASSKIMLALNGSLVAGNLVAYLISAIVSGLFENWRIAFFLSGAMMLACAFACFAVLTLLEKRGLIVCSAGRSRKKLADGKETERLTLSLLAKHAFFTTVVYTMVNGFVRNAVSFWIPTYIKETFAVGDSTASVITMVMPILNFLGTMLGLKLLSLRFFRGSEHILCAFLFGVTFTMFGIVFALGSFGIYFLPLSMVCIFIAAAAQNSACNMIYAVFVFRFKNTGRISAFTGGLDSSAYLASAIGTKTIGLIASAIGWNMTVGFWGAVTLAGLLACVASAFISRKNGVLNGAE